MKRLGAIFLFCIYTIGATELEQLLRFPMLVHHYFQHREENPAITIVQFLNIHYVQSQPFDADYDQDMQLPFKQSDEHCLGFPWQLPVSATFTWISQQAPPCKYILLNVQGIIPVYQAAIFKPPTTIYARS